MLSRILYIALFLINSAIAAELTGTVKNFKSGEPLDSAQVTISAISLHTSTNRTGKFVLKNIPVGMHVVEISKPGFSRTIFEQTFQQDSKPNVVIELRAQQDIEPLDELPKYSIGEITVLTTRASADHPVTYDNLTSRDIIERNYGQDLPLLLSELPNLHAYSDGGNGVGYSYLRMRGFSQNRIAAQINGVPLNDALSHEVFWVDLPDFANDLADIQVQRGVGSSLYGPAALGGSINLATKTPGLGDTPKLRSELSYGSWNTRRASLQFQSGRIDNRYGFNGRLTRMESDGYRNGSWTELWSYFLSASRFTKHHTSKVVFYGGPEKLHLAYEGITDSTLKVNREFNPLQYPGEIDNFFQPHYELHDEWTLSNFTSLFNTFYLFRGDGFYDQYRPGSPIQTYVYDDTSGQQFDLLRRRNIAETDWGFIPRLTTEHRYGTLTIGAESRIHNSHHEGFVVWANPTPIALTPDYKYYDYRVQKHSVSGFVHEIFEPVSRARILLDFQAQSHRYELHNDQLWNVEFNRTYQSLNPRIGGLYLLTNPNSTRNRPALSIYTNYSLAQREPAFADIYDPQDFYSLPISAPNRFQSSANTLNYIGPELKPEKLSDLELGMHSQWNNARCGINYYHMTLRDEIVPYAGQLDDNGVPVSGNAEKTLHSGIEIVGGIRPISILTLDGSLAFTNHKFLRYQEFDWTTNEFVSRNGNRLAYDANLLGNLRATCTINNTTAALAFRTVGKQFIDNTENEQTAVPAYHTFQFDLGHRFNRVPSMSAIDIKVHISNLLNKEYESFGYIDFNDGLPRYLPAATRSIQLTTGIEF